MRAGSSPYYRIDLQSTSLPRATFEHVTGIWKIISDLLNPVVTSKVHFVIGAGELADLVPAEHIIKELGGPEDWECKYIEPGPNENERLHDTAIRDFILGERNALAGDLFNLNADWITGS